MIEKNYNFVKRNALCKGIMWFNSSEKLVKKKGDTYAWQVARL